MKSSVKNQKKLDFAIIIRGVFRAYLISLIFFLIMGGILYFTSLSENVVPSAVIILSAISIIISGIRATKDIDSMGWLHGGLIGFIYVAVLMAVGLLAMPSVTFGVESVTNLFMGFVIGSIAGVLGMNI